MLLAPDAGGERRAGALPFLGSVCLRCGHIPAGSWGCREPGLGLFLGCSPAAAGRKGDGDQAHPADPGLWLWEDETQVWPALGSWGKDGRKAVVGGKPQTLCFPLFCWAGWPNLAAWWDSAWCHLVWWCMTRGSVVPELVALELVQNEAVGANWEFWSGCLGWLCLSVPQAFKFRGENLTPLPACPSRGRSRCSWHRKLSVTGLCCEHGLGLINTPGAQGPKSLFPQGSPGRPRRAGRGWEKWHWRMLRDISHTGWHMWLGGPNGSGSCRDRHLSALAASASVSFGGEFPPSITPWSTWSSSLRVPLQLSQGAWDAAGAVPAGPSSSKGGSIPLYFPTAGTPLGP